MYTYCYYISIFISHCLSPILSPFNFLKLFQLTLQRIVAIFNPAWNLDMVFFSKRDFGRRSFPSADIAMRILSPAR